MIGEEGVDEFDIRGDFDNVASEPEEYSPQGEDPDYIINSQVDVDGGTGDDRLVVVGTEGDDKYVVTEGRVYGGGLVSSTHVVKVYPSCLKMVHALACSRHLVAPLTCSLVVVTFLD